MPDYLYEDLMNVRGYIAKEGKPNSNQAAVALTDDGRCVFGDPSAARSTYARHLSRLMYYDDEVERQRRLLCDTALGQFMLDHPRFAQPAVNSVSSGIETYWRGLSGRLSSIESFRSIAQNDLRYVPWATSFGRLPVAQLSPSALNPFKAQIEIWLGELRGTDLPKIMNLHDAFLRIYCSNNRSVGKPSDLAATYMLREAWFENDERGRGNRTGYKMSSLPGLITGNFTIPVWQPLERCGINFSNMRVEERVRGTDRFRIEATMMRPEFRQVLGDNNLVFAASASGTTSTLLASAKTFQPTVFNNIESKKQYLMGCIAYLVGGGMHTCHEVFYTGGLAGLEYTPGKYVSMLPNTFKSSRLYERWSSEFWDIVRSDRPSPR
ncbi:MAG: hypothetical protein HQK76_00080 [Desulfobacterales bacterium]|nr:hypothetical protein [Desulfobacterales bacterium]